MKTRQKQVACTIYHNPRCTKSRATLALLQEHGIEPTVIEYLKTPPTVAALRSILSKLKLSPNDIVRKGEEIYATKVGDRKLTDAQLIATMIDDPVLIERPIVVIGERAVIGRPPENVLPLLK